MKKFFVFSILSLGQLALPSYAKTLVCDLATHSGESSVEITGPYAYFSQIIIDTELKMPGTNQAHIEVKYKNGIHLLKDILYRSHKEGYFTQNIARLDDSRIKVISKSYFNKQIFDLDLKNNLLKITTKKNINVGMVTLSPKSFYGSKTTYHCSGLTP